MEQAVPPYNRDRVSDEFRLLADQTDAKFRTNLRKLASHPEAVRTHDELLAHSCVYGYLYDRHFLHNPELLLNELRWLRATQCTESPRHAIHPARYLAHRQELLELLVRRFQNALDSRDGLDPPTASEPAVPRVPAVADSRRGTVRQSSDRPLEGD